jgi:hypothetical protein
MHLRGDKSKSPNDVGATSFQTSAFFRRKKGAKRNLVGETCHRCKINSTAILS